MRKAITLAAVLVALPVSTGAYTYHDLFLGGAPDASSSRSLGMGHARVASDTTALAAISNPALLGFAGRVRLDGALRLMKADADWAQPVHDAFDGVLTWNIYSTNTHLFDDEAVAVAYPLPGELPTVAVAVGPIADFRYRYQEEVRDRDPYADPRDTIVAQNYISSDGVLRGATFAAGTALWGGRIALGAGVQVAALGDDVESYVKTISYVGLDSRSDRVLSSPSGTRLTAGLALRILPRMTISALYTSKMTLDGDLAASSSIGDSLVYSEEGTYSAVHPSSFAFGIEYRPVARMRSRVAVEVEHHSWSNAEWTETGIATTYAGGASDSTWTFRREPLRGLVRDSWELRMGIEHRLGNDMPFRFGFRHRPEATDKEVRLTAFTFGVGLPVPYVELDLGLEIGSRSFRAPDQFDDALWGGDTSTEYHRVRESIFAASIGVAYSF